ncbi:hypothetical protein D9613_002675 [Agrocybe pediades]|uniref:DUF3835 domain-containing protein n=1 Tax=Agrocybe pediades TaxID=84607 RepID=A0A8H4QRF8_9AGAR|nr:hypothetical protein D9613_002675 [Agrocybe pediades]
MSQAPGNVKFLSEASDESIRALIQAVIPDAGAAGSNNLSGDALNRLTAKLSQLMGPEATQGFEQNRNERGELLNEEGLPIIDITEPDDDSKIQSIPPPITVEPLIPLANLPAPIKEQLREKRNRILDALEEEERLAEIAEQEREAKEMAENMRKRKEEATKEKDRLKQARELQKKMGRALLENVGKAKQKEQQEQEAQRLQDLAEDQKRKSPSAKKKTVAFADVAPLDGVEDKSSQMDWGDITPARLQPQKRRLMTQSLLDKHPMKMSVVERVPGGQPTISKSSLPARQSHEVPDSDDESDPEKDSEVSETDVSDEEPVLETDEVDYDFAQHQREIALEYYKKRNIVGQEAAKAMMNHSHDLEEEDYEVPEHIRDTSKPAISQFEASRLASAYSASAPRSSDTVSTSLGASVVPESSTRTIQHAIRTGKLDADGRLVGAEDDSASEQEDENMQEILDLLRKGQVYNLGPNGEYLHVAPPAKTDTNAMSSEPSVSPAVVEETPPGNPLPPNMGPKTSKFKVSRAAMGRPAVSQDPVNSERPEFEIISPSPTPVSHVGRSSPKSADSPPPVNISVAERKPSSITSPIPSKAMNQTPSPFSMIVESPSFPIPVAASIKPSSSTTPATTSPALRTENSRRPQRPPTVIAASVLERKSTAPREGTASATGTSTQQEKKVSRFKAERM